MSKRCRNRSENSPKKTSLSRSLVGACNIKLSQKESNGSFVKPTRNHQIMFSRMSFEGLLALSLGGMAAIVAAKSSDEKNKNPFVPKRLQGVKDNEGTVSTISHDDPKASLRLEEDDESKMKSESVQNRLQGSNPNDNSRETYGNDLDLGVITATRGSKDRLRKGRTLKAGKQGKKEKKPKGGSAAPSSACMFPSMEPSAGSVVLPAEPSAPIENLIGCAIEANYLLYADEIPSYACPEDLIYGPMENWDTKELTTLRRAFYAVCYFFQGGGVSPRNIDWASINAIIEKWNTESVTNFYRVFSFCQFGGNEPDLSCWDTANVETMKFAFSFSDFNHDGILGWDVGNVNDFTFMFQGTPDFNQPLGDYWVLQNGADISAMFRYSLAFSQCMSPWDAFYPTVGGSGNPDPFFDASGCVATKFWCTCNGY